MKGKIKKISILLCFVFTLCGCTNFVVPYEEPKESNISHYEWRGSITDRNGLKLSYPKYKSKNYAVRTINPSYPVCFSNIINNTAQSETGLDYEYDSLLRIKNNNPVDYNIGNTVITTLDAELQGKIYNCIFEQFQNDFIGSIVVMKQNGEILADVSYPSFNYFDFKDGYSKSDIMKIQLSVNFQNQTMQNIPVHLTILKELYSDYQSSEQLFDALCFYDEEYLDCDFGKLENNVIQFQDEHFINVSPIYLACLTKKIVTDTDHMTKPFLLKEIVDSDDYTNQISVQAVLNEIEDGDEKTHWEKVFNSLEKSKSYEFNSEDFNENAFAFCKGNYKPNISENYKFAGKVETELQYHFMVYGMFLNVKFPDDSFIFVLENSKGINNQKELKEFYQKITNIILK